MRKLVIQHTLKFIWLLVALVASEIFFVIMKIFNKKSYYQSLRLLIHGLGVMMMSRLGWMEALLHSLIGMQAGLIIHMKPVFS